MRCRKNLFGKHLYLHFFAYAVQKNKLLFRKLECTYILYSFYLLLYSVATQDFTPEMEVLLPHVPAPT